MRRKSPWEEIMSAKIIVIAVVAGSFLAFAAPASAGSVEEAEQLYAQGQQMFDSGKFQEALDLFTKAYSTYPKASYVFGIANCYVKLDNLPRALDAYEMFTQYDPTPDVLKTVEAETTKLKEMLSRDYGEVFIFSSPSGAQIIIDEISKQNIYQTPTRRWLKEGSHSVFFKKDGVLPRELKIDVKKGEGLYIYAGLRGQ